LTRVSEGKPFLRLLDRSKKVFDFVIFAAHGIPPK